MEIKYKGKINDVPGTITFEELKKKMKKPHLCSSCGVVACVGGRNLKNAAIRSAIDTKRGVYVVACDDYVEGRNERKRNNRELLTSSSFECSIVHPAVKHVFIR